jgi:hypothetical protein
MTSPHHFLLNVRNAIRQLDLSIYQRDDNPEDPRSIAAIDFDKISRRLSAKYVAIETQDAGQTVMTDMELRELSRRLLDMQIQVRVCHIVSFWLLHALYFLIIYGKRCFCTG